MPGDWYGPQAICCVLKKLNKEIRPLPTFSMVVCNDGNVFFDKIQKKIDKGQSVFVSIPVRLGLNSIQPEYLNCLKRVFDLDQTVGIAGGQESNALYFVGIINPQSKDPKLLYLDPHFVQNAIPTNQV
jgi:cysteine protease ATG4